MHPGLDSIEPAHPTLARSAAFAAAMPAQVPEVFNQYIRIGARTGNRWSKARGPPQRDQPGRRIVDRPAAQPALVPGEISIADRGGVDIGVSGLQLAAPSIAIYVRAALVVVSG
jgi:hypothetical protein